MEIIKGLPLAHYITHIFRRQASSKVKTNDYVMDNSMTLQNYDFAIFDIDVRKSSA